MEREIGRTKDLKVTGKVPIKYRVEIEFDPPRLGVKKPEGKKTRDIQSLEVFTSDEHALYWLVNAISRQGNFQGLQPDIKRAEAVILDEDESYAVFKDLNPQEDP